MKLTKQEYELYLNRFGAECPQNDTNGNPIKNYGGWLRRNDPILFGLSYNEWVSDTVKHIKYKKTI